MRSAQGRGQQVSKLNAERSERAQAALDSLGALYDDPDAVVVDLLTDLMHLMGRHSIRVAYGYAEHHHDIERDGEGGAE